MKSPIQMTFDEFKDSYAKNYSYVCAKLIYSLLLNNDWKIVVSLPKIYLKVTLREEINHLINSLPHDFGLGLILYQSKHNIISTTKSSIQFVGPDLSKLRGMYISLLYCLDDPKQYWWRFTETEYPNLYELNTKEL